MIVPAIASDVELLMVPSWSAIALLLEARAVCESCVLSVGLFHSHFGTRFRLGRVL